jgi:hypothetical protein
MWGLLTDEGEADGSEGGCCHREEAVVDELLVERELIGRAFKFHKVLNETDLEAHVDRVQTLVLPLWEIFVDVGLAKDEPEQLSGEFHILCVDGLEQTFKMKLGIFSGLGDRGACGHRE